MSPTFRILQIERKEDGENVVFNFAARHRIYENYNDVPLFRIEGRSRRIKKKEEYKKREKGK